MPAAGTNSFSRLASDISRSGAVLGTDGGRPSVDRAGGDRMSRQSRRRFLAAAGSAVTVGLGGCGQVADDRTPTDSVTPAPVPATQSPSERRATTVVTFDGIGPVSVAFGPGEDLYMAMGVSGEIRRLQSDRTGETGLTVDATERVTTLDAGNGFLYAIDILDETLYAALSSREETTHGIWKLPLDGDEATRIAAFDPGLRLRGILVDAGRNRALVTHARRGGLSTVDLDDGTATRWLDDQLFDAEIRGATGLTRKEGMVYVTNFEHGRVVQVPVADDGSAGTPSVYAEDTARLSGASGLTATDEALYVAAANLNRVIQVGTTGDLRTLAAAESGLDLPTDVALTPAGDGVFVANFGFEEMVGLTGSPSLIRLSL